MPRLIILNQQPTGWGSLALGAAEGLGQGILAQDENRRRQEERRQILADQMAMQDRAAANRHAESLDSEARRERFQTQQGDQAFNRQKELANIRHDLEVQDYNRTRQDKVWDTVDANEIRAQEHEAAQRVRDAQLGREMARDQENWNNRAYDNERADANAAETGRHNRVMEANAAGSAGRSQADDDRGQIDAEIRAAEMDMKDWATEYNKKELSPKGKAWANEQYNTAQQRRDALLQKRGAVRAAPVQQAAPLQGSPFGPQYPHDVQTEADRQEWIRELGSSTDPRHRQLYDRLIGRGGKR